MAWLNNMFGLGNVARDIGKAVKDTTEVFHVNESDAMREDAKNFQASLAQFQAEFANTPSTIFGQTIDGLNRLPRPMMAIGTISLFVFALIDPDRFTVRMEGLQSVPDPLWWLMGAIVSFYFGARELHYLRMRKSLPPKISPKISLNPSEEFPHEAMLSKGGQRAPVKFKQSLSSSAQAQSSDLKNTDWPIPRSSDNPAVQAWISGQNQA